MTAQEAIDKIQDIVSRRNLEDDDEKLRQIEAVMKELE